MKTRKAKLHLIIYMYAVAALLLTSCENEIPYNSGNRKPLIVMNALLDAGETENFVYLHLSEGNSIGRVNRATLSLYVNGQLTEEPQPMTPQEIYEGLSEESYGKDIYEQIIKNIKFKKFRLRTQFQPGDHIRLEATAEDGEYKVSSEVVVPKPVLNIQVDTCITKIFQWNSMRSYRRILVTLNDLPNEKNCYRLDIQNNYHVNARYPLPSLNEDGSQKTDEDGSFLYWYKDTVFNYTDRELINREDIILTDGHISHSDQDEDNEMFPSISNKYNIFTDNQFTNSSATLKVYTALSLDYLSGYDSVHSTLLSLTVRLLSISKEEYLYLKGLNCMDDDDYDTTLMEPVSLPSNVEGGLGFVGISAQAKVNMEFPEKSRWD
ncbi:DUF4249 domain-containing protein [Bacteroides sp.]|uniref:DUF4249 domain-containing protein n=1 Tax=Bacteroides sp. TaxID=29523 RepID=UPI00262B244E|nr:DUF4249 domain-containing protein [Bacteroides sp.]